RANPGKISTCHRHGAVSPPIIPKDQPLTKRRGDALGRSYGFRSGSNMVGGMIPHRPPRGLLSEFMTATAFLTRIPVETSARGAWQLADSAWAFPLIGAGIGAVAALAFFLAELMGLGSWPAALLA